MEPAKAFVIVIGKRLHTISPHIVANPAVNNSIFRINRDTRFSQDKSPYKTHMGILFWEGDRPKMEYAGFNTGIHDQFYSVDFIDYCFQRFNHLAALHKWLVEMPINQ